MIRASITLIAMIVVLACGRPIPGTQVVEPTALHPTATTDPASSQTAGEPTNQHPTVVSGPVPTPTAVEVEIEKIYSHPPIERPAFGDTSIEEKIAYNAVIVRATMASFSADVYVNADGTHSVGLQFNLAVSEYLKGTGPSSIAAFWIDSWSYDRSAEVESRKADILATRDDQWDDREAVFFLYDGPWADWFGTAFREQLQRADGFLLGVGST